MGLKFSRRRIDSEAISFWLWAHDAGKQKLIGLLSCIPNIVMSDEIDSTLRAGGPVAIDADRVMRRLAGEAQLLAVDPFVLEQGAPRRPAADSSPQTGDLVAPPAPLPR